MHCLFAGLVFLQFRHWADSMKQRLRKSIVLAVLFFSASVWLLPVDAAWSKRKQAHELNRVDQTIQRFLNRDPSIRYYLRNSYGYVVFPSIGKGALFIGIAYGRGLVFRNGRKWVGHASVKQASVGAQFGGQAYSEIIFFGNRRAYRRFTGDLMKFTRGRSAVAVVKGSAKRANYEQGVVVFSIPKAGLMYEAYVGGQSFRFKPRR